MDHALPASHYDAVFTNSETYLGPANESPYKIIWDKTLEKLPLECRILDIGCGPGQFATLCVEAGHPYVGADFSETAVNLGRRNTPGATFHLVDMTKDKSLLVKNDYDAITFIEFFEHINEDLEVLNSVPEGKKIVLTVPKYWCKGHVRVFRTPNEVFNRYGDYVEAESLDIIAIGKTSGRTYESEGPLMQDQWVIYILSGTTR